MHLPLPVRLFLLGFAGGGRTTAPPAALAWTARSADPAPTGTLDRGAVRATTGVSVVGELVLDKLPQTPSRLLPPSLFGRLAVGAAAGVALAVRDAGVPLRRLPVTALLPAVALGAGGAYAGSHVGASWRRGNPFGSDLPAALLEDATVMLLSLAASRR